jgi:hypothetical protein
MELKTYFLGAISLVDTLPANSIFDFCIHFKNNFHYLLKMFNKKASTSVFKGERNLVNLEIAFSETGSFPCLESCVYNVAKIVLS